MYILRIWVQTLQQMREGAGYQNMSVKVSSLQAPRQFEKQHRYAYLITSQKEHLICNTTLMYKTTTNRHPQHASQLVVKHCLNQTLKLAQTKAQVNRTGVSVSRLVNSLVARLYMGYLRWQFTALSVSAIFMRRRKASAYFLSLRRRRAG